MARTVPRGLFVTGTDTGVGKTVLSGSLIAAMVAAGESVRVHKPVLTGLEEPPGRWPPDHELLALLSGMTPEQVAPRCYAPALSPHLAAELAGEQLGSEQLLEAVDLALDTAQRREEILVIEGVGGLLVPLATSFTVRDLALAAALPLLIAARPGLGTINHTLLTIDAARTAGLQVAAVVLGPWEIERSTSSTSESHRHELERSNLQTIARLGEVEVFQLPYVSGPERDELARAGEALPWRAWL
jgi:dethiobiotin synthetase